MFLVFSWFFFIIGVVFFCLGVFMMNYNSFCIEFLIPFYVLNDFSVGFMFDYISLMFFSSVSFISSVVFLYSKYYMNISLKENSDQLRFISLLFLFVFSMFFLVFSLSWPVIMLGWDGLGIVSFLLVVYFNDPKSLDSGLVTVFTNRIGDCLFLLSFMFMFYCGDFSFFYLSKEEIYIFCFILCLGCITKSAQLPFSSWLPAAMAAPTPVSSLVHSSTLVTAGVFLLIRYNYLVTSNYSWLMVVSLTTMSLAGMFAVKELDFKKVVAMSTLSQLGFMVFSISMGLWLFSFLHMVFHAFFKSSLFLSTGSLMHSIAGNQDSRMFGGFLGSFFSKLFFYLSCLSLMGFPFSLGFYSKDLILGYMSYFYGGIVVLSFCFFCCFTVAYSLRLMYMGYLGFVSFDPLVELSEDKNFWGPVLFLFIISLFSGNFYFNYFIPSYTFSFVEFFLGVGVIALGFCFFCLMEVKNYSVVYSLSSMFFLPYLVSFFSLVSSRNFSYKMDFTWGEMFSGQGVYVLLNTVEEKLGLAYKVKFSYYFFLIIFLVLMIFLL